MLPSQHHANFSIALKRFMISLYARLMSFPHKINPLDYAMNQKVFAGRTPAFLIVRQSSCGDQTMEMKMI
jgi:hypothetical protein